MSSVQGTAVSGMQSSAHTPSSQEPLIVRIQSKENAPTLWSDTFGEGTVKSGPSKMASFAHGLEKVNGVIDAATGIYNVIKTFREERARGDTRHQGTMEAILSSVAQNAASFGVAGVAAGLLGGVGIVPVALGIGAGYLVGQVIDRYR